MAKHHVDEAADRRHDSTVEDSFPASDPPAHSGITGPRNSRQQPVRRPPHERGDDQRPTGHPTSDRHGMETAYQWEHEQHPPHQR